MSSNDTDIFSPHEVKSRARAQLAQDDPAGLLARGETARPGDLDLNPDFRRKPGATLKPAAVLVPVLDRPAGGHVLLTTRTDALPTHAGQIAFPGGKIDAQDKDPVAAALRETEEEIGLTQEFIDVIGFLDPYETGTGYRILPVVAIISPGFSLVPEPGEVADIFEVPLSFLMSPKNHIRDSREIGGRMRHFHAMPYQERYIWGATAGILKNLYNKMYKA